MQPAEPALTVSSLDPVTIAVNLMIVMMLVAANGFFVAAEFSLVSVRQTRIDQLVEQGNRVARIIARAKTDPNRFLSASQIGITLASLALGWVAEPTVASLLLGILSWLGVLESLGATLAHTGALIVTFVLITYMHIVLGEFVPKALALQRTEPTVLATAWPLELLAVLCTPFIHVLNRSGQFLLDRLGIEAAPHHHLVYTEDELKRIVSASHEVGILEAQEQEMLHKVFAFSDRRVRELMVPRTDMQVLPVTATFAEVVRLVISEQHTRMPVYNESIDDIVGVLNAKDLFQFLTDDMNPEDFNMRALLRPVPFVPESKAVDDLLAEMKKSRTQMAIVMDEFGGTAGLISLEDLLEELVGEIEDEFDEPEHEVVLIEDGVYRIDGKLRIADFNERFGTELSTEDYDTIAGLVFGQLGREPLLEDVVEFERLRLVVEAMEGHRITWLRLHVRPVEPPAMDEVAGTGDEG